MLCQEADIEPVTTCPDCKTATRALVNLDSGVFLGCVFARYFCRKCNKTAEANFPPLTGWT